MKRHRFARLMLCLPLIWVMALWAFSYGNHDRWEKLTSHHLYWALSSQGQLHLEMDNLDFRSTDSGLMGEPVRALNAPWWSIWATTLLLTVGVHAISVRARRTKHSPSRG